MTTSIRGMIWSTRNLFVATAVGLLIVSIAPPARAADNSGNSPVGVGLQVASWVTTVPYGAAKVAYALTGGIVGGLTWILTGGNTTIANAVWVPSITGDYIVQPQNLTGEKSLHFVGGSSDKPTQ